MQPFKETTASQLRQALINATRLVGNDAVVHFKNNFLRQGFNGKPWKQVQRRIPGTRAYNHPAKKDLARRTRNILFGKGSGRLFRSIRVSKQMYLAVAIGTDVPYAKVHNEGFRGSVSQSVSSHKRARNSRDEISRPGAKKAKWKTTKTGESTVKSHSRKIKQNIPARTFMGMDRTLEAKIKSRLDDAMNSVFRR